MTDPTNTPIDKATNLSGGEVGDFIADAIAGGWRPDAMSIADMPFTELPDGSREQRFNGPYVLMQIAAWKAVENYRGKDRFNWELAWSGFWGYIGRGADVEDAAQAYL